MGTQNIRSRKVQILVKQGRRVITTFVTLFQIHGAIVYRLGHKVFILVSGVRFPVALPSLCGVSHGVTEGGNCPEVNAKMRDLYM